MTDNRHPAHPHDEDPLEHIGRPVRVDYEMGTVEVIEEREGDDRGDPDAEPDPAP